MIFVFWKLRYSDCWLVPTNPRTHEMPVVSNEQGRGGGKERSASFPRSTRKAQSYQMGNGRGCIAGEGGERGEEWVEHQGVGGP